jgi:hypothetical protein
VPVIPVLSSRCCKTGKLDTLTNLQRPRMHSR